MPRSVLCLHRDDRTRARLVMSTPAAFTAVEDASPAQGAVEHGRSPFDVVMVELVPDATVIRSIRQWHPQPAIVAVGGSAPEAVEAALIAGAHDHLDDTADASEVGRVIDRSWHRHRAARTSRAGFPPPADMQDVQRRVDQLVSLTAAARDLLEIDEAPHTTVRSLLEQAGEIGHQTARLAARPNTGDDRTRLDLPALVHAAWHVRGVTGPRLDAQLDDVEVHGHPGMLRTALIVLYAHATRGGESLPLVRVDTELLGDALRLRVHDDGPVIDPLERGLLFTGDDGRTNPSLLTVEHVAARHGGTAWLADSDVLPGGTMAVIELPRRAVPR